MDEHTRLRTIAIALTALDLVGARVAQRHHLIGEPLRLRIPSCVPTPLVLLGWGTAVSAPWSMDAALIALLSGPDRERARMGARVLGALRVVGVLAEPATWGRRRPRWAMVLSAGHLTLGGALVHASTRPRSARPGVGGWGGGARPPRTLTTTATSPAPRRLGAELSAGWFASRW